MGNAQITQLSKAITSGADKGVFVLPKGQSHDLHSLLIFSTRFIPMIGPSGRVKLPPKTQRTEPTDAKEVCPFYSS